MAKKKLDKRQEEAEQRMQFLKEELKDKPFTIKTKIVGGDSKAISIEIDERLQKFLDMVTVKSIKGRPAESEVYVSEDYCPIRYKYKSHIIDYITDTEYSELLFLKDLIDNGKISSIPIKSNTQGIDIKLGLAKAVNKIIEAETELLALTADVEVALDD